MTPNTKLVMEAAKRCAATTLEMLDAVSAKDASPTSWSTLVARDADAKAALIERSVESFAAQLGLPAAQLLRDRQHAMMAAFDAGAMFDRALNCLTQHAPREPRTQYDMRQSRCSNPACDCQTDVVVLHARCHQESPAWAVYDPEFGTLTLRCAECEQAYEVIRVARGGEQAAEPWLTDKPNGTTT